MPFQIAVASVRLSARIPRAGHFFFSSEEKVTKKTPPRMPRRLRRFARPRRGSLNARPRACNELARIVRAILTDISGPPSPRQNGDPKIKGKIKSRKAR